MALNPVRRTWTVEEYLQYELETDMRYEYIDGEIYAMSGGTAKHTFIKVNMVRELSMQLKGKACRTYDSDMRVKINETRYLYPDISFVCGDPIYADQKHTMLTNPTLVVEVLSPTSEDYDKGSKFDYYRSLPSLQGYLVVDQTRMYAALHTPEKKGWLMREFKLRDDIIPLDMIGCELKLEDMYYNVEFDE